MKILIGATAFVALLANATPPSLEFVTSDQHLIASRITAGSESINQFDVVYYSPVLNPLPQCKDSYLGIDPRCVRFDILPGQSIYVFIGAIAWTDQFCETTSCPHPNPRAGNLPCGTTFSIQAVLPGGEVSNVLTADTQPCTN